MYIKIHKQPEKHLFYNFLVSLEKMVELYKPTYESKIPLKVVLGGVYDFSRQSIRDTNHYASSAIRHGQFFVVPSEMHLGHGRE